MNKFRIQKLSDNMNQPLMGLDFIKYTSSYNIPSGTQKNITTIKDQIPTWFLIGVIVVLALNK